MQNLHRVSFGRHRVSQRVLHTSTICQHMSIAGHCLDTHIHIYIYIYTYTYIHTYIHTYVHMHILLPASLQPCDALGVADYRERETERHTHTHRDGHREREMKKNRRQQKEERNRKCRQRTFLHACFAVLLP